MSEELALRDIHLPMEIGFWPPAPGWWLLALVCLVLLGLGLRWFARRSQKKAPTPDIVGPALRELERIENQYRADPNEQLRALSALLRRITMSLYGREQSAGLTGQNWLDFLKRHSGSRQFTERFQKLLTVAPYHPDMQVETSALIQAIRSWLSDIAQKPRQKHV